MGDSVESKDTRGEGELGNVVVKVWSRVGEGVGLRVLKSPVKDSVAVRVETGVVVVVNEGPPSGVKEAQKGEREMRGDIVGLILEVRVGEGVREGVTPVESVAPGAQETVGKDVGV